jgi:hypothetical protein
MTSKTSSTAKLLCVEVLYWSGHAFYMWCQRRNRPANHVKIGHGVSGKNSLIELDVGQLPTFDSVTDDQFPESQP